MVAAVLFTVLILQPFLHMNFFDATTESMVFIFLIQSVFSNLLSIPYLTFQAKQEIVKRSVSIVSGRIVKVVFGIVVATAGVTTAAVVIAPAVTWPGFLHPVQQFIALHAAGCLAVTYLLETVTSFFVGLWFFRRYPIKKPNWALFKNYFVFALPLTLVSVIEIISVNVDKVMIGYFWTATEVGYYFAAQRIIEFLTILSSSVGTILFPAMSEQHALNDIQGVIRTARLSERYISMITIPPIVVIAVFINPVIKIMLSDAFLPAASVLVFLLIYAFIVNMNVPYNSLIAGINKPGYAAIIGFIGCGTNIVLNFLFVPRNGVLSFIGINGPSGSALASIISGTIGFIWLKIAAKKFLRMKVSQSHTPRHLIAGIIMGAILYYVSLYVVAVHWYDLIVFAVSGLGLYITVLFVLREFNKCDLLFFFDMLNPKKLMKYVRDEVKGKSEK